MRGLPLVMAACALMTGACGGGSPAVEASGTSTCGPVETPQRQGGEHLIGAAEPPVPYSSVPPTSGWHGSGVTEVAVHAPGDPLPEPRQVSVLEGGGVVVTYHRIPDADRAAVEDLVRQRYDGRVAVTPYDKLEPGQVATTAYGVLQVCDGLDLAALTSFVDAQARIDVQTGH